MVKRLFIPAFVVACMTLQLNTAWAQTLFNIKDYGARSDGEALNTEYIQEAIDACSEAGGGKVLFPAGTYLTGTIYLRDNVYLHLDPGATILGSTDIHDYPKNNPDHAFYRDEIIKQSLIYAEGLENIGITGHGTIDGQGAAFKVTTKVKPDRYMNRPYVIWMIKCKNIVIENVRLQNSPYWMQHYMACDNLSVRGISVYNHCNQNNDMIDIDGCHNVTISDCIGDTDDDALTFKTLSGRMNENITVTNCILSSHCNAIKFGTETSAGFKNVVVSNCVIKPSADREPTFGFPAGISGIVLEIVDGGIMDGISISDIVIEGTESPIFIRLGNRARKYYKEQEVPGAGEMKNISIRNITARNCGDLGCTISGIPGHPVRNIRLSNISIEYPGGVSETRTLESVPELEELYPESTMFGLLPSYGFYIRHAENIQLDRITFRLSSGDERPAIALDDVKSLKISSLSTDNPYTSHTVFHCSNARDININGFTSSGEINSFISLEGNSNDNIVLMNNDFSKVVESVTQPAEIPGEVIIENNNLK